MTGAPTRRRRRTRRVRLLSAFSVLLAGAGLLAAQGRPADAALDSYGAIDPVHGYPVTYTDSNGLALQLCLDDNGMCLAERPDLGSPMSFPDNFPDEAFWWAADTQVTTSIGLAKLRLALESAFLNGPVVAGDQISFARVRIRVDVPTAGTYTITHPFGTEVYEVTTPGVAAINDTVDIGCELTPCDFGAALGGAVDPFLVWDPAVAPAAPAGYIGDPNVEHAIVGSPTGNNLFRVEGPSVGGFGVDSLETDQFALQGKLACDVLGTESADLLVGTAGDDIICGLGGGDIMDGLGGSDVLIGGPGDDTITGGAGDDTVEGGAGSDTANYSTIAAGVTVSLATGSATGGQGSDTLRGIENVRGSSAIDTLTGDGSPNRLYGMNGKDVLTGGAGDDVLEGGNGNDTHIDGAGSDTVVGGAGIADVVNYAATAAGVTVDLGAGTSDNGGADTLTGVENVVGSAVNDVLTGDAGTNKLDGGGGADTIDGALGSDTLRGQAGADTIVALDGVADVVNGGGGSDTGSVDVGIDVVTSVEILV